MSNLCEKCWYYSTARGIRCSFDGHWNPYISEDMECPNFIPKEKENDSDN